MPGPGLKLNSDGSFSNTVNYEGGDFLLGSYQESAGKLYLYVSQDTAAEYNPHKLIVLELKHHLTDIYFSESLAEQGNPKFPLRFWNQKSRHAPGTEIVIDSFPVIVEHGEARLGSVTRFYEKPDRSSPRFLIELFDPEVDVQVKDSFDDSQLKDFQLVQLVGYYHLDPG
jgi:hypothetical protein